jgi:hypothetical protein
MKPKRPCESVPGNALVLSGLANSCVGNFSLIRFRKGQTLWSTELHFRSPIYIDARDIELTQNCTQIWELGNSRISMD